MPDVIDFLVLKQNYDTAMQRKWKAGKGQGQPLQFRTIITTSRLFNTSLFKNIPLQTVACSQCYVPNEEFQSSEELSVCPIVSFNI